MKLFRTISIVITYSIFSFVNTNAQSYVPEWKNDKIKVQNKAPIKAYAFNLKDVKLLESPFTRAMDADVAFLVKLEPDRLLSDFLAHAGLEPKAKRYGGWESSGLAGHTLGHYLSALSMHYATTRDEQFKQRVDYIVDELKRSQVARKSGYVGAIPNEDSMWAEVAKGNIRSRGFDLNGAWSPWYTLHKIMAGLVDAYLYCDNKKALEVNTGIADWAEALTRNLNDSLMQKMLVTEYGGMNDVLVNTYSLTGNKKYLDLSYRFHDRRILDSLAMRKDILPGKHSNTQIPKVIGTARRYQLTGDRKDFTIADFFWQTVVNNHSYATGGNSNYEYLGDPNQLSEKLSDNTTETCNTYNMLKLTRQLFALNPSARLMDYYEKALYNHILASQNHQDGMMTYFVSLRMGGKKEFSDPDHSFTCCVGSGIENHVKYGESIYYRGQDGSLYINLFIPSILSWKEHGATIKQETNIPGGDKTTITLNLTKPKSFTIRIRKPHWTDKFQLQINGSEQSASVGNDGYIAIKRNWKNGDKIEFVTPADFYTEAMPDNANRKAVFYGPVLLAGILGDKEPQTNEIPVFVTNESDPNKWVQPAEAGAIAFQTKNVGTPSDVKLMPFHEVIKEHYSVYWDVFTPDEWAQQQKIYEEEKRKEKELKDRTVDFLRTGEMQPERDHDFVGEKTSTNDEHGRKWRAAGDSGYFAFKMKVDPMDSNTLVCTYWGEDNRGRRFDILIEDSVIATEDLTKYKMNKFYDISYTIPKHLTASKSSVVVKLVPKKNNSAGPVYGIRMAKGDVSHLTTKAKNESIFR